LMKKGRVEDMLDANNRECVGLRERQLSDECKNALAGFAVEQAEKRKTKSKI